MSDKDDFMCFMGGRKQFVFFKITALQMATRQGVK
jgi:hypothetical protein